LETILKAIEEFDQAAFLFLNHLHHPILDFLMLWASDKYIWIPLYGFLLYLIVKTFKTGSAPVILALIAVIVLSDQTASSLMKPLFERFRPCHDPELHEQVRLVAGCGGKFGFASSHAANTFGLAFFIWAALKTACRYIWTIFLWAALVSYSRIYLGVHYPGDILAGALIGAAAAGFMWRVYKISLHRLGY